MSVALTSSSTPASTRQEPLRVMVVDDSVVIRGLISRWIASEPDMVVAASLRTGLDAVNQIERVNPDVAVLDIEMPELDGISALPLAAGEETQPHHHHGFDPDPPQRGDQLQGALARGVGLHSEARKHPRSSGRRNLPPRSDPENPLSRRQGPPRGPGFVSPPLAPTLDPAARAVAAAGAGRAVRNCCAARSARRRRARF